MKFYIVAIAFAFAFIATVASEEWTPKPLGEYDSAMKKCIAKNPLSQEERETVRNEDFSDTEAFHKLILCGAKTLGVFCEEGGYHAERVVRLIPKEALEGVGMDETEALAMIEKCADKNEEGSPAEVWAFRGFKCIMNPKFKELLSRIDK